MNLDESFGFGWNDFDPLKDASMSIAGTVQTPDGGYLVAANTPGGGGGGGGGGGVEWNGMEWNGNGMEWKWNGWKWK